jgi:hypothetical protein
MTGGGLSTVDWGREQAVGGSTRKLLKSQPGHITDPEYRKIFQDLVKANAISVIYEHRLASVHREGASIRSIELDLAPPDRFGCPSPVAKVMGAQGDRGEHLHRLHLRG